MVLIPFILFGGFFVNSATYPAWVGWFQYLSPIRYGFEALMRNEFDENGALNGQLDIVKTLNLEFGKPYCLLMLAVTALITRIIGFFCLQMFTSKFQ